MKNNVIDTPNERSSHIRPTPRGGGLWDFTHTVWRNDLAYCMYILGAAALGFLLLNWNPAEIVIGDVCSGFIAF